MDLKRNSTLLLLLLHLEHLPCKNVTADLFELKKCSVVKTDIHSLCRIFSVCKWCMHLQTMPRGKKQKAGRLPFARGGGLACCRSQIEHDIPLLLKRKE